MDLNIPDDLMAQAKMSRSDVLIELACRLFQAQRLTLHSAAKLAELTRAQFENILLDRNIPLFEVTSEDLHSDLENLKRAGV